MSIGYNIPMQGRAVNRFRLYMAAQNLFVITSYTGVDPEVGYGSLGLSTDKSNTPRTKDFTLGVSLGF